MLEKLLHEIRSGGTLRTSTLARRLGTSPAMVEALLDDLRRRGIIQEVALDCGPGCGGCPLVSSCVSQGERGRLWQLTEKLL